MRFLKNKKGDATTTSLMNVGGAMLGVMVIVILVSVSNTFAGVFGDDARYSTQAGFNALVTSIEKNYVDNDIVIMNLDGYYIDQNIADCSSRCICLYETDHDQVAKECFSKEVRVDTGDRGIGKSKTEKIFIEQSEHLVTISGESLAQKQKAEQAGRCCICKLIEGTGKSAGYLFQTDCTWVEMNDARCSQKAAKDVYGVSDKKFCPDEE